MNLRLTAGTCAVGAIVVSGLLTVAANVGGPDYRAECRDAAYNAAYARIANPSYTSPGLHPSCAKLSSGVRDAITTEVIYAVLPLMLAEQTVEPCDLETSTDGATVTYGAGTPGCLPGTVTY